MEYDPYKIADIVIKILALSSAAIGAIWAYHKYTDAKEKDFYSQFWNTKLELFLETSSAAATMATTNSVDDFESARIMYWELFYGRLSLVEGKEVKNAMIKFSGLVPKVSIQETQLPYSDLEQPAYQLTIALKKELGKAWKHPFGEL